MQLKDVIAGLAVSIIGSRQVNAKAEDGRHAASDATVDPGPILLTETGVDSAATRRDRYLHRVDHEFALTRGNLREPSCRGHPLRGAFDADFGAEQNDSSLTLSTPLEYFDAPGCNGRGKCLSHRHGVSGGPEIVAT